MPRAETPLVLPPRPRSVAASRWLYEALRGAILEGRLAAGARLPTTREMARQYDLARGTVVAAFDALKDEGYVHATVGSGTYVCCELPESLLVAPRAAAPGFASKRPQRKLSAFARRLAPLSSYAGARAPAFRLGQPALEHFPTTLWAQVASRRLRLATPRQLLDCDPLGYEPLRRAIADYLVAARGVSCT